jgi:hypothetical protein
MLASNFNGEIMDLLPVNLAHCCSGSTINISLPAPAFAAGYIGKLSTSTKPI